MKPLRDVVVTSPREIRLAANTLRDSRVAVLVAVTEAPVITGLIHLDR